MLWVAGFLFSLSDLYSHQKLQQQPVRQDQHSHESGFQSATSLTSLEGPPSQSCKLDSPASTSRDPQNQNSPPGSTLTGSISGENDQNFNNRKLSSADSYGSLASSYLPQTRTSSILKSHQDELFSNRRSLVGTRTSRYFRPFKKIE